MATIEEIGAPVRKAADPIDGLRDGDGDGLVADGTPLERPASVIEDRVVARMARAFKLERPVRVTRMDTQTGSRGGPLYGRYTGLKHGFHRIEVRREMPRTGALAFLAHEMIHARQRERYGEPFMDIYQKLHQVHGYKDNPLEVEARRGADLFMKHLEGREDFFKVRDGDGDGWIYDGTPRQRPAPEFSPPTREGATGLPVLPWVDPPEPRGVPGMRKPGGYSANGRTATAYGDLAEEIVRRFGLSRAQELRQGALDGIADGWGYEIKARSAESTGYRVGMKTGEMKKKRAEAKRLGLKPGLILIVTDERSGRAYVYHRAGIANGALSVESGFHFAGTVEL